MKWNSTLYDGSHTFVSAYGSELISYIPSNKGQCILDLGCGTGDLAQQLYQAGNQVVGIDSSKEMIDTASSKYPHLQFKVMDATGMEIENAFDVVFSNAVFHWITDQRKLLKCIYTALKNGGKLICEFGADGNISKIETAYRACVESYGGTYDSPFCFPSVDAYAALLIEIGFDIETIYDYDRKTALSNGKDGLKKWMTQFFAGSLSMYDQGKQGAILRKTETMLAEKMFDGEKWIADYRRLRVIACKTDNQNKDCL